MEPIPAYIIEVSNLSKSYGKKKVLSSISLQACQGECIGILGANGCGKSTLLAILSGCLKADTGTISYLGKKIEKKQDFHLSVGYVPQENPLFLSLTVLDNLRYFYADSVIPLKEDLENGIPHIFGLTSCKKTKVKHLSGGMKRRLAIACALACHPPILILDEPGASLDFVCKEDIKNYLSFYRKHGGTVILTSHEQSEIELCSHLFLLKNGSLSPLDANTITPAILTKRMR